MQKVLLFIFCFALACTGMSGQALNPATQALKNVSRTLDEAKGISAHFTFSFKEKGDNIPHVSDGELQMLGACFHLSSEDIESWYNGKLLWAMLNNTGEVNLSVPDKEELLTTNPYFLFREYNTYFHLKLLKDDPQNITVQLNAKSNINDIANVILTINKSSWTPSVITLNYNNGSTNTIQISKYKSGLNYTDKTFVFDKKQFPNVEIIDLR